MGQRRDLPMYELGKNPRLRPDSIATRELPLVAPGLPADVRPGGPSRAVVMPSGKTPPGGNVVRSAAVATHVVRQRKTPQSSQAYQTPASQPAYGMPPPSQLGIPAQVTAPIAMTQPAYLQYALPNGALTPPVVKIRRRPTLEFGPGGKAILILAALSVVAVIISTILTSI